MANSAPRPDVNVDGDGNIVIIGNENIITKITNIFKGGTSEELRALRNRLAMLKLVSDNWIDGFLKNSLYHEALIELGLEMRPDAYKHPWDVYEEMPDHEPSPVPPGTTMLELFDQANYALLILGEPGSGKTTELLELARQAIERAQKDITQPIPVVFALSSWKPGLRLAEWLVEELQYRYFIPPKVGEPWVKHDDLLLLLDGLDEVRAENREACVSAINAFRAEHNAQLVICSRRQEYEELSSHLKLRGAVLIQPLTEKEVDDYFQKAGTGLEQVHRALQRDPELMEFARTPLVLSVLAIAYRNASPKAVNALEAASDRYQHLFNVYVWRMFKRKVVKVPYTPEQTVKWLTWLATQMVERGQSLFNVEDIKPSWLWLARTKRWLVDKRDQWIFEWFEHSRFNILHGRYDFYPADRLNWQWSKTKVLEVLGYLGVIPLFGMIAGLIGMIFSGTSAAWQGILNLTMLGGVIGWFPVMVVYAFRNRKLGLIFALIVGAIWGLIGAMFGGLLGALAGVAVFGPRTWVIVGLIIGLYGWFMFGTTAVTNNVLSVSIVEQRSKPGAGIQASIKNTLIIGLFLGLMVGSVVFLVLWLLFGLKTGLIFGLIVVLIVSLIFGWFFGGNYLLGYFATRYLLRRSISLPRDIIDFLDYCTNRIFLRKVGGGYIFVHRMLMDYFADKCIEYFSKEKV